MLGMPPKLSAMEYQVVIEGLATQVRDGRLDRDVYHALLKKVAEFRDLPVKPEVRIQNVVYQKLSDDAEVAHGYALDHPRLGRTQVRTSLVVVKADTYFETLNTRYVIVPDDAPESLSSTE